KSVITNPVNESDKMKTSCNYTNRMFYHNHHLLRSYLLQ
ncbi:conserved hypothetical protein, partial [Trichinella spiralis]